MYLAKVRKGRKEEGLVEDDVEKMSLVLSYMA